jgi:acyl-CoA dehydrogenase
VLDILRHLLTSDVAPATVDSIASLRTSVHELRAKLATPIDRAIVGGYAADRVGYAFAAGYQAALDALIPTSDGGLRAFCATEHGGAHPRAVATRLEAPNHASDGSADGYVLSGTKRWATFAPVADVLLVIASSGHDSTGRNRLRVVRASPALDGVSLRAMPATPFAPEIPHAELHFERVVVSASDVLEGDGYDVYLKPLPTVEDIHVLGALLGHVCGVARTYAWPNALVEDSAFALAALHGLALSDPTARETHVALGGAFRSVRALLARAEPEWARVDAAVRARWERDRALLDIAESARAKRLDAAWREIG